MTMLEFLQWPGVLLSLCGSLLIAQASARMRRGAFMVWILSNMCLIGFALHCTALGLIGMYVFNIGTCAWRW